MFERFTDRARRVLVVAQDEARSLHHSFIGPEHIVLGLIQGEGVAAKVLGQLGVRLDEVRGRVAGVAPVTTGQLLLAILADEASQATKALQALGVSADLVEATLAETPLSTTSDAPPRARAVHIRLGEVTTTIDDPDLAAALGDLTPEQIAAALRSALGPEPGRAAAG